ncbi:TetR family transcriptional regulator [Azorhizobium sp. AG788]|uniref:TetR/AcrR family transcriptional regulator n=1 Tax=Azorhizobium sp. AG788 TaxID=2183897 RepID=UPI0010612428|nr:TetR/AcrR family transcriptional regulator [Azorhizobium sp. AG788]TDT96673.1 TetR family transcriptional regulator [Azorhizobium sp. AG788]
MTDAAETAQTRRRTSIGGRRNPESAAAILDAAAAILAEDGLGGFSIEAVARRAGAGKPTIYRWWPNKAALLIDVYARQKETVLQADTGSLQGDLEDVLSRLFDFWRHTPAGAAFRSIIAEAQSDPEALERLRAFLIERRAYVREIVERGIARGDLPADADGAAIVEMLFGFAWMRLLTGDLGAAGDIPRRVHLILKGAA